MLVETFTFIFCSFQSGLFSCQSVDLYKTQTSPSGTCSKARTLHICFSLLFLSLERTKELFFPSYACKSGWGVTCDTWDSYLFSRFLTKGIVNCSDMVNWVDPSVGGRCVWHFLFHQLVVVNLCVLYLWSGFIRAWTMWGISTSYDCCTRVRMHQMFTEGI